MSYWCNGRIPESSKIAQSQILTALLALLAIILVQELVIFVLYRTVMLVLELVLMYIVPHVLQDSM